MSDTVIKVENLSKKYIIGHQRQERYTALRDVMAEGAKNFARRLTSPFTFNVSRLTDTQEEFYALKDVSFEIKRGDRVGIIGRNGAGKSTLLKILSRITEPTSGRIEIDGRVASLLEVGTGFHPELTGRENIFLNGAILGMTRAEIRRKFDEIVAFAEIEKFLDTPVKRYSSGMYVRLAFAVAAHLEPEILIVDEVLAVGDAQFQKKCLGKMRDVGKEGRTVLLVSHNMSAINHLCNFGLLLDKGLLSEFSEASKCIKLYSNSGEYQIGELVDNQVVDSPGVVITKITINGSGSTSLSIGYTNKILVVEITFISEIKCNLSIHAFLKSSNGLILGIYSPGHMDNSVYVVNEGEYTLYGKIILPNLTKGKYYLELGIADPGVKTFVSFPSGVELLVDGTPSVNGLVFDEGERNGFLVLNGELLSIKSSK